MPEVRFSVVIRCTRGVQSLSGLLRALGEMDYPAEQFEVVLADSSRREKPDAVPDLPPTSFPLRYLPLRGTSHAEALNIAVRESRGEFLAFIAENCIPAPDWLHSYDRAFDAWLAGVVGGSFRPPKDGDAYQKCVGLVHNSLARSLGLVTGQQLVGRYYPLVGNMSARRESILLAGGFDEQAVECPEIRMALRMQLIGYRAFYSPSAVVYCRQNSGLIEFLLKDFHIAVERARFCGRSGINFLGIGVIALVLVMLGLAYDANALASLAVRLIVGGYALVLAVTSLHAAVSVGSLAVALFLPMFLAMHHVVYAIGVAFGRFTRA